MNVPDVFQYCKRPRDRLDQDVAIGGRQGAPQRRVFKLFSTDIVYQWETIVDVALLCLLKPRFWVDGIIPPLPSRLPAFPAPRPPVGYPCARSPCLPASLPPCVQIKVTSINSFPCWLKRYYSAVITYRRDSFLDAFMMLIFFLPISV